MVRCEGYFDTSCSFVVVLGTVSAVSSEIPSKVRKQSANSSAHTNSSSSEEIIDKEFDSCSEESSDDSNPEDSSAEESNLETDEYFQSLRGELPI